MESIKMAEKIDLEYINKLARLYADICKFKSDFPHHEESVIDGFIEGFRSAERILSGYEEDEPDENQE